jgi:hypothetical protein
MCVCAPRNKEEGLVCALKDWWTRGKDARWREKQRGWICLRAEKQRGWICLRAEERKRWIDMCSRAEERSMETLLYKNGRRAAQRRGGGKNL